MTALAVGVLWFYRASLVPTAQTATGAEAPSGSPAPTSPGDAPAGVTVAAAPLVVAVAGASARAVSAMAVPLARARGGAVHVLHIVEQDVVAGEDAVALESEPAAGELLDACVAELRESGATVSGELLRSVGDHGDVADLLLRYADGLQAGAIVIGPDERRGPLGAGVAAAVAARAPVHVLVLHPKAGSLGRPLTPSPAAPLKMRRGSR